MALINPHINFNGNAEEAFMFYKSVFGGEFAKVMRFKDLSSPENPFSESEANKIMHIALPIGNNILMANDVPESMGPINYSVGFQQVDKLKCLFPTVLGVPILECLETDTELNGW